MSDLTKFQALQIAAAMTRESDGISTKARVEFLFKLSTAILEKDKELNEATGSDGDILKAL